MKRGTPHHPKTLALAAALDLELWGAVGVLECLWHFAQRYAQRGDIGKFSDAAIARGVDWSGNDSRMIAALVSSGWLDPCPCHRLRVHDWPNHADAGVHNSAVVKSAGFIECYKILPDHPRIIGESLGVQPATAPAPAPAPAPAVALAVVGGGGSGGNQMALEIVGPKLTPERLAWHFVSVFNAAFSRKVSLTPKMATMVGSRLKQGHRPQAILALPIMVAAQDPSPGFRIHPEMLLRDGTHKRTGANGQTFGATDWLDRALQRLDQTQLPPLLAKIAEDAGVLEYLTKRGATMRPQEVG